jgi:hypothetical protein
MAISDTTPEAAGVQLALMRQMGPERRLRMALEASETVRGLFESGVRSRNPDMSDREIKREVGRLLYGVELPG